MAEGEQLIAGATVRWNGTARATTRVDSTRLTIGLTGADRVGTPSALSSSNL